MPVLRPTVAPAARWPRTIRGPWAPMFVATRGDTRFTNPIVWALTIDGELHAGWDYPDGQRRNVDGRGRHEWLPRPIDPRNWSAGDHEIRITVFAAEPDPNPSRVIATAAARVRFEHADEARLEAPVPVHPRVGKPVPHVGPFFVAPFYHYVRESLDNPARRTAYLGAQLRTHTESVMFAPGARSLAQFQDEFKRRTAGYAEYFAAHPQADLVLIWDDLPQWEAAETRANPATPAIIAWVIPAWQELTGGRVRWLRVLDEAAMKWGYPVPAWIQQVAEWLREPCRRAGVPVAFSGGGGVPADINAAYAQLTGCFDLYSSSVAGDDQPARLDGLSLPQWRKGHDHTWRTSLATMPAHIPLVGLVSGASWYYTKGDSDPARGWYDPDIDFAQTGSGRGIATAMQAGLKLLDGACGVSVYFDDCARTLDERRRETFPRSVLPEPCQTGCSPFATGETREMWRALGALQRFTDALGLRLFGAMREVPTLAPGVRGSGRGDDVLLLVNTREVPATTRALPGAARRRLRLHGAQFWTEAHAADAPLTLQAGEVTALVAEAARP